MDESQKRQVSRDIERRVAEYAKKLTEEAKGARLQFGKKSSTPAEIQEKAHKYREQLMRQHHL